MIIFLNSVRKPYGFTSVFDVMMARKIAQNNGHVQSALKHYEKLISIDLPPLLPFQTWSKPAASTTNSAKPVASGRIH